MKPLSHEESADLEVTRPSNWTAGTATGTSINGKQRDVAIASLPLNDVSEEGKILARDTLRNKYDIPAYITSSESLGAPGAPIDVLRVEDIQTHQDTLSGHAKLQVVQALGDVKNWRPAPQEGEEDRIAINMPPGKNDPQDAYIEQLMQKAGVTFTFQRNPATGARRIVVVGGENQQKLAAFFPNLAALDDAMAQLRAQPSAQAAAPGQEDPEAEEVVLGSGTPRRRRPQPEPEVEPETAPPPPAEAEGPREFTGVQLTIVQAFLKTPGTPRAEWKGAVPHDGFRFFHNNKKIAELDPDRMVLTRAAMSNDHQAQLKQMLKLQLALHGGNIAIQKASRKNRARIMAALEDMRKNGELLQIPGPDGHTPVQEILVDGESIGPLDPFAAETLDPHAPADAHDLTQAPVPHAPDAAHEADAPPPAATIVPTSASDAPLPLGRRRPGSSPAVGM